MYWEVWGNTVLCHAERSPFLWTGKSRAHTPQALTFIGTTVWRVFPVGKKKGFAQNLHIYDTDCSTCSRPGTQAICLQHLLAHPQAAKQWHWCSRQTAEGTVIGLHLLAKVCLQAQTFLDMKQEKWNRKTCMTWSLSKAGKTFLLHRSIAFGEMDYSQRQGSHSSSGQYASASLPPLVRISSLFPI